MLKVGIVGAGLMGRWHAHTANQLGAQIRAVVDLNFDKACSVGRRFGAAAYTDVLKMLQGVRPDIVHVCTPLETHSMIARQSLQAGVHVLIEKPLGVCAAETRGLYELANAQGLLLCPVHQFVFQKGIIEAVAALECGALGNLVRADFNFASAGGLGQSDYSLDNIIFDILPHPLSLLCVLCPRHKLNAFEWHARRPRRGELAVVGMQGDLFVSIFLSLSARPPRCTAMFQCTGGTIHADLFHGFSVKEVGNGSRMRKIAQPFILSGKILGKCGVNLLSRSIRREPAYPGLRELFHRFFLAVTTAGISPIPPTHSLAVAEERDYIRQAASHMFKSENKESRHSQANNAFSIKL